MNQLQPHLDRPQVHKRWNPTSAVYLHIVDDLPHDTQSRTRWTWTKRFLFMGTGVAVLGIVMGALILRHVNRLKIISGRLLSYQAVYEWAGFHRMMPQFPQAHPKIRPNW